MNILEPISLSDEQLVYQYQQTKDSFYFEQIYKRYYKRVFYTCLKIIPNQAIAHDLAQDVMIKVYESLGQLRQNNLLGGWINRIARNYCFDYYKRKQIEQLVDFRKQADRITDIDESETQMLKEQYLCKIEKVLPNLKPEDQILIELRYFQNYSVEDLMLYYNLAESAVKMRLARVRKRLTKLMLKELAILEF